MPEIGINDVLIKVLRASICGTDVHIWNWDDWAPDHSGADGGGHELSGGSPGVARTCPISSRRCGERRGPRGVWPLPELPAGGRHLCAALEASA